MSDLAPEFRRRLRFTPARDLLRGRISGRLDLMATIARSGLPKPAQDLIRRVAKRTRLWMLEKVQVADELIAHFHDGLESGSSLETLIEKFGNERQAAKLIRRAKKRNRPLAWNVLRGLGWIIVVLLGIYGFLAARFVLSRPSPSVDYVAILNRPILAAPEEQRGWPVYRQAILLIGEREKKGAVEQLNQIIDAKPGSEHWAKVGPWLKEHEKVVELTRQGAQRPMVGFILGREGSIRDPEVYPDEAKLPPRKEEGVVVALPLHYRNELRLLADFVAQDARVAREQRDPGRMMKDLEALLKLPPQMHRDSGFLVTDMVALGLWEFALGAAEEAVPDERLKLSDEDLQKLAHSMSGPKVAADLFDFAGERIMIRDLIQRSYSDDGNGNGHLTVEGHRFLCEIGAVQTGNPKGYEAVLTDIVLWAIGPVASSRKDLVQKYEQTMDLADANLRRPMREADWHPFEAEFSSRDQVTRIREPILNISASLKFVQVRAEHFLGHRDGVVTGIALELYRRKYGEYPASLEVLVPQYLPRVPADRITGQPVKYRIVSGKPVIYSVGADRDDDGGKPPPGKNGWMKAATWSVQQSAADGDWVLYPQSTEE